MTSWKNKLELESRLNLVWSWMNKRFRMLHDDSVVVVGLYYLVMSCSNFLHKIEESLNLRVFLVWCCRVSVFVCLCERFPVPFYVSLFREPCKPSTNCDLFPYGHVYNYTYPPPNCGRSTSPALPRLTSLTAGTCLKRPDSTKLVVTNLVCVCVICLCVLLHCCDGDARKLLCSSDDKVCGPETQIHVYLCVCVCVWVGVYLVYMSVSSLINNSIPIK